MSAGESPSNPDRIYLHETGWQVGLKSGSERVFCHTANPGEDFYHRFADGEVFFQRDEERICAACALRRGVITHEPKLLPQFVDPREFKGAKLPPSLGREPIELADELG
jgi:hypothetical protein